MKIPASIKPAGKHDSDNYFLTFMNQFQIIVIVRQAIKYK
jgi:hypothetical protein